MFLKSAVYGTNQQYLTFKHNELIEYHKYENVTTDYKFFLFSKISLIALPFCCTHQQSLGQNDPKLGRYFSQCRSFFMPSSILADIPNRSYKYNCNVIEKEERWHELKTEGASRLLPLHTQSGAGVWTSTSAFPKRI